jgi:hypothetical protein
MCCLSENCLLAKFGEKARRGKQAIICKLLVKSGVLYRSLAFLTRFTKFGQEANYLSESDAAAFALSINDGSKIDSTPTYINKALNERA